MQLDLEARLGAVGAEENDVPRVDPHELGDLERVGVGLEADGRSAVGLDDARLLRSEAEDRRRGRLQAEQPISTQQPALCTGTSTCKLHLVLQHSRLPARRGGGCRGGSRRRGTYLPEEEAVVVEAVGGEVFAVSGEAERGDGAGVRVDHLLNDAAKTQVTSYTRSH